MYFNVDIKILFGLSSLRSFISSVGEAHKVIMFSKALCAVRREVVCNAVHRDKREPSVSPDASRTLNKVASLTM